ncbi:ran GTPase-activating protein 1 [Galendromus occidentalis]|uniref:Ran GTPase-activating protein 1 n=1 Tax=Galendromus occidentalis TaxID=34638 RepID=A0AAJ7PBB2_9ACAR|nr:ran GTPase-activating protein 1 [Galendromus occidentalis]
MAINVDSLTERFESQTLDQDEVVNFKGAGKKLDNREDIEPVCQALAEKPDVTIFCLQGNTLGSDAAKCLGDSLSKCPKLQRLQCEDIFTGRMKTDIPVSLGHFSTGLISSGCQLVELDFSGNAFGELAINALYSLLTASTCFSLRELRLHNTGLGPSGGVRLAQALLECLEKSEGAFRLETFVCGRSRLENEGAKALAKFFANSPDLKELIIPQNGIFKEGLTAIGEALTNCPEILALNVNDNILSAHGAEMIKTYLAQLTSLRYLNVGDCVLRSKGAEHLAEAIQELHDLRELHLGHNEIEIDAGLKIVEAVANKANLSVLELDGNCFGKQGIALIEDRMEKLGLIEALCAFSEDEDEADEDEDDDGDGSTFESFAASPTLESLLQLQNPREQSQAYLENFQCLSHAGFLRILVKIASACDGSEEAVEKATECAAPVMEKIAQLKYEPNALVNEFAVHYGFVKDEERSVRTLKDITGLLLITASFLNRLPVEVSSALKTFVLNMDATKCSKTHIKKVLSLYESF